jgi:hypothetical protein
MSGCVFRGHFRFFVSSQAYLLESKGIALAFNCWFGEASFGELTISEF